MMSLRVEVPVVHTEHDRHIRIGRGGRDDHLLGSGGQMLAGAFAIREPSRRFDDHVDVQLLPREFLRILDGQHPDRLAIDDDLILLGFYTDVERAVHRVVFQEIRECFCVREVVNGDKFQSRIAQRSP